MRETEGFRPQLELLVEMFPARAAKKIGGKYSVSLTELARWMTKK